MYAFSKGLAGLLTLPVSLKSNTGQLVILRELCLFIQISLRLFNMMS